MISCLSVLIACWLCTARAQLGEPPRPMMYELVGRFARMSHSALITNAVGESEWIINLFRETTINVQYQYPTIDGKPDLDINISITASRHRYGRLVQEREEFTLASHSNTVSYLTSELRTKVKHRDITVDKITIVFNYTIVPCGSTVKTEKGKLAMAPFYRGLDLPMDCVWHIISQNANAMKTDVLSSEGKLVKVQGITIFAQQSGSSMLRTIYNSSSPNKTTYHYSDDLKITLRIRNADGFSQVIYLHYESFPRGCSTHFSGIEGEIVTPSTINGTIECLYIIDKQPSLHTFRLNIAYPKLPSDVSYYLDVQRLDSFGTVYETNGTLTTTDHTFDATGVGIYYKIQAKSHIVVQPMHLSFKYISDTEAPTEFGLSAQLRKLNSRSAALFQEYLELISGFIIERVA